MSDVAQGQGEARAGTGAKGGAEGGVMLECFSGDKDAGKARHGLDAHIAPGTSMIVAWAGKPVTEDILSPYTAPGSQRLILRFNPVEGGAVLEAA